MTSRTRMTRACVSYAVRGTDNQILIFVDLHTFGLYRNIYFSVLPADVTLVCIQLSSFFTDCTYSLFPQAQTFFLFPKIFKPSAWPTQRPIQLVQRVVVCS